MLYLHHEELASEKVLCLESAFDNYCKAEWFTNPLIKKIIRSINNSDVTTFDLYDSPILGIMGPEYIAGGVKLLIWMLNEPEYHFPAGYMGDNCAEGIYLVSNEVDCHLQFDMYLPAFHKDQILISPKGTLCRGADEIKHMGHVEGWY